MSFAEYDEYEFKFVHEIIYKKITPSLYFVQTVVNNFVWSICCSRVW